MRVSLNLVKEGTANACVSAGNTGALMATAKFVLKTLPGIDRPAISALLPTMDRDKNVRVLDLGANVDSTAEQLFQFAIMGSVLASSVGSQSKPAVGLLNIGEEKSKGNRISRETHELLSQRVDLNFIGNIEGRGVFLGLADVIVCDGFIGNIFLKTVEGLAKMFMTDFSSEILDKLPDDETTRLLKGKLYEYAIQRDYKTYGGALLLGVNGLCFICHGRSKSIAIKNALGNARMFIKNKGIEYLQTINFKLE